VVWRIDDGGSVAVAIEGDKLYYASLSDTIYEVNKKTGTVGWKFNFREKDGVPTQPVIYRGLVLVGASDGALMALSQISGKLLASYRPGVGVFATPALDAKTGEVWIHSNQANLHKLKIFWWRPQDNLEWKGSIP
jgi:outer membrane protein assembly factor BamB